MAQRIRRRILAATAIGLGIIGSVLVACSDDDPAPAQPGTEAGPDTATPDTGPIGQDGGGDAADAAPPPWSANVGVFNARSQATDSGIPELLIPSSFIQVLPAKPKRAPDVNIVFRFAPLGCTGYKFTSTNPADPGGPGFSDGDLGTITINGFTGGKELFGDASIPKPLSCKRAELFPGAGFSYNCDFPGGPTSGFLAPNDKLTADFAGGADSPAFKITETPNTAVTKFTVTTDLWNVPGSAVDGTSDFQVNYNCGGACNNPTLVAVLINTSDGTLPADAGPPSPFDYPNPAKEFSQIVCIDLFAANESGFKVPANVMKVIQPSWKHLNVTVVTANANQGVSSTGIPASLFLGDGVFGITHR